MEQIFSSPTQKVYGEAKLTPRCRLLELPAELGAEVGYLGV